MTEFILITGDKAMFNPTFGQAIVTMRPLRSQLWSVGGKYIWLDQMTKELNISCQAMIK